MEQLACFLTHVKLILETPTLEPLSYSRVLREYTKPNSRFDRMRNPDDSQCSNLNRLPTELILKICEHLSIHDLWHSIRPTSCLLAACAQEILPPKFFSETSIHISWCCFWCSLGHPYLRTTCSHIIKLFPNTSKVHIDTINDRVLIAKAIFGNVCNLVTSREPRIRIRLDEEERDVMFEIAEILPQGRKKTENSVQGLQMRQHQFLVRYFAKRRRETAKCRADGSLRFAAHLLRFFAISIALFIIGLALALVLYVLLEGSKLLTNSYKSLRNLTRMCLVKGLNLH